MTSKLTPMMLQYQKLRSGLPVGTLLFFKLGDFYELFFNDAQIGASILNVALTKRGDTPMCGVPCHAIQNYIQKLLLAGWRVALSDQVGDVEVGKLVKREVTHILSPGTMEELYAGEGTYNFTAVIVPPCKKDIMFGLAIADLSIGELRVMECEFFDQIIDELAKGLPAEILISGENTENSIWMSKLPSEFPAPQPIAEIFNPEVTNKLLLEHFNVYSLDGLGLQMMKQATIAVGSLLFYFKISLRRNISHCHMLKISAISDHMVIDRSTQNHLQLLSSEQGKKNTLFGILNQTLTPMGCRKLSDWISHPLINSQKICERQDVIEIFLSNLLWFNKIRDQLRSITDIERSLSRLNQGSGNARDLNVILLSLKKIPEIISLLNQHDTPLIHRIKNDLKPLPELSISLEAAIINEPPATVKDGGFIRSEFNANIDQLRRASQEGKSWIMNLQKDEIEKTGIKSLKIRFNNIIGYFIEITNSYLNSVPKNYIRKQKTSRGEHFITSELKEIEEKITGSETAVKLLEYEIFQQLRMQVIDYLSILQKIADAIGEIDVLASFAERARLFKYKKPLVDDSDSLMITDGYHPVLQDNIDSSLLISNDTNLESSSHYIGIITGPNMGGKSTYLRQVGLLVIMAQIGSWIPVSIAHIGIIDKVFTRVGASDNFTMGHSTFMVEMHETSNILRYATSKSLILLDEIGRGTSTFDGLSIAWSVVEYLHNDIKAKTLFATHYHELPELSRICHGVKNWHIAVEEKDEKMIFLRKLLPGYADKSYGIQVARLAGLPKKVIDRAMLILQNLEKTDLKVGDEIVQKTVQEINSQNHFSSKKTVKKSIINTPLFDIFNREANDYTESKN